MAPPVPIICIPVAAVLQSLSSKPAAADIAWLWHSVFEALESAAANGRPEKRIKRTLIQFLAEKAHFLYRSPAALRWMFNRKLTHWRLNGRKASALVDHRSEANAKRRAQLSDGDRDKLIATALFKHDGDMAPAWRDCLERGELSPEINQRYLLNPSRKSHMPRAIARDVTPEIETLLLHYHGARQARLNGAYIERDWSNVGAGDRFTSDDFTLEILFSVPDGKGWFSLCRGQFLPMVDERSKRILDFVLVLEKNYTGINVRTLINKVCARYGLPRRGFKFECSLWKNSQLVGGAVPYGELKLNFAEKLDLEIEHAQPGNARSKIVENVGKLFQARLRGEPGWVGPNEQVLKIEHPEDRTRPTCEARRGGSPQTSGRGGIPFR